FKSFGSIDNIENIGYSSYQPKHTFTLAGHSDGKAKITATHAKTKMETELDITVETLKDKLYLFQFYPMTATTITYKNNKEQEIQATSNANGELALFEEDGI